MRIDILTLFPGMFSGPLTESILQRAQSDGKLDLQIHDLREWGDGKHRQVDDTPYGGGAGMVMRVDVLARAIDAVIEEGKGQLGNVSQVGTAGGPHKVYLSPRGKRLDQPMVEQMAAEHEWLLLLCGHYEGIDHRVIEGGWIDEELSIGDYVLTGGELPAMVLIDAVARHIPGVLGDDHSAYEESFSETLDRKREYPHYTRPEEYKGLTVPDVLLSGHHGKIEEWRRDNLT